MVWVREKFATDAVGFYECPRLSLSWNSFAASLTASLIHLHLYYSRTFKLESN